MSYPSYIQTLIVEDEQEPTENYRRFFKDLAKKVDLAPPVFARSFDSAIQLLSGDTIFHLVVVDLGLPQTTHGVAQTGVEPGITLVSVAARREKYPVPSLLVCSGRLNQTRLDSLLNVLQSDFWYGQMVNKNGLDELDAIEFALGKIHEYCDIGIHLRDSAGKLCPTLSPREEDLLRRCVLKQSCVGIDIEWWGNFCGASRTSRVYLDPTKVLMGRFLLREGMGSSRPSFFKFESSQDAAFSHRDAAVMVQKLGHVKLLDSVRGTVRSLLVTQQVGESSTPPISVDEFVAQSASTFQSDVIQVVNDIAAQLSKLGDITEDKLPVSDLMWKWNDAAAVREAYERFGGEAPLKPHALLQDLQNSDRLVFARRQSCIHGDLNPTNIAIERNGDYCRAYIFDAAGIHADSVIRDFATFEVTLLLHHGSACKSSLVNELRMFYAPGVIVPNLPTEKSESITINTARMIREIRQRIAVSNESWVYALMVFDCAMLQLGGLSIQSRGNKILEPRDAVLLADLTANWLQSLTASTAPE